MHPQLQAVLVGQQEELTHPPLTAIPSALRFSARKAWNYRVLAHQKMAYFCSGIGHLKAKVSHTSLLLKIASVRSLCQKIEAGFELRLDLNYDDSWVSSMSRGENTETALSLQPQVNSKLQWMDELFSVVYALCSVGTCRTIRTRRCRLHSSVPLAASFVHHKCSSTRRREARAMRPAGNRIHILTQVCVTKSCMALCPFLVAKHVGSRHLNEGW